MTNDERLKIGIITHYYGNNNYGGVLQAYALCKKLDELGYEAIQISYDMHDGRFAYNGKIVKASVIIIRYLKRHLFYFPHFLVQLRINKRLKGINDFRKRIPHTKKVYDLKTICGCNGFDVYVTGSDQVWNPSWVDDAFLLKFVTNKKKFSYAASLGVGILPKEKQGAYANALADYSAISAREACSVDILQQLTDKNVELVLDPTLLLNNNEWSELCEGSCPEKKYVFCYFLGEHEDQRKLAAEYAKGKGYLLLSVPFLNGRYRESDANFDCIDVNDVTVGRFINLIEHAGCVFTDSFHASVFSHIFCREFFVFCHGESELNGSGRLFSLTDMFDTEERVLYSDERRTIQYIMSLPPIDYNREHLKFDELKTVSIEFLKNIEVKAKDAKKK